MAQTRGKLAAARKKTEVQRQVDWSIHLTEDEAKAMVMCGCIFFFTDNRGLLHIKFKDIPPMDEDKVLPTPATVRELQVLVGNHSVKNNRTKELELLEAKYNKDKTDLERKYALICMDEDPLMKGTENY